MATNNDDIKWLYGKLKAKGYNIGTEQEFQNSLANEEDRKWYYEKAKGIGLNFGDMDDFDSLYAPQPVQPSTAQQQPVQKEVASVSTTARQAVPVAAGGAPMPEASVTEQPAMKPATGNLDGFGGGMDAFDGSEAAKRMQHYREVIKERTREDEAKRKEEMANRVAEMEFLKDATDFYTRMAEESKARKADRKESNDEYARMMKEQARRNAVGRKNADKERAHGVEWEDPDYRRELDAIEPEYSSEAKEEASGSRSQHGVESTPEGEALASRQHRGMMSEEEARQLSTEAYDGKTILAYDKDRKGADPVTGKGGYIDRTRYPAKARVMKDPEDIWSVRGKVDRTFTSKEPGGLPELSVTGISKAALKRRYDEYLRLHPELGDVAENSDKSRELMGSLRSEMIDEGRAVDEAFETWKAENPHKVRNMSEEELAGKREEIRADREFTRRMGNLDLERDYIFRRYGERTAELTAALRDEFESKGLKPEGNRWLYALDAALRGDEELKALDVQSYNLGKAAERYEDWIADGKQGSIVNFAQGAGGALKEALMNPFGLAETQGSMIPLMHIKRKLARERMEETDTKGKGGQDAKAGEGAGSSLSQDEVLALESYFLNQETQGRTKMSLARNSGEFTGALAEMAAEFGLNPASGLARRTLARMVAEVGKDGAMSLIRKSSRLARMVGYKGVEVSGARVAVNLGKVTSAALGEGAVMSATTQGLKNFNAAAGRTITEPVYDNNGNLVDVNGESAGSAAVKTGVSSALTNAAFVFPATFGAKAMRGFDNMAKTMHVPFGNPVDALVKMKSGEAMSILTADAAGRSDIDPTWSDFADPEKNGELIMGLLAAELTSGAMRGTVNVANGARLRHGREMAKAEMMAKAMRGAEAFNGPEGGSNRLGDWRDIVKAIYEGDESTIVDALVRIARDGSMTPEQKEAALDYARSAYRYIGADRAYEEWRTRGEREAAAREAEEDWNVISEDTREMWEDEAYTRGYEAGQSAFAKHKPEEGRQNEKEAGVSEGSPEVTRGEAAGETSGSRPQHGDDISREMRDARDRIEDAFSGSEAEYYMAELEENPWRVLEDPELTADQQEVVLDFINAKNAMKGMMDASGDVLNTKRKEIERSVEMRIHKKGNVIIPVVKNTGEEVYLVKGHVAMTPDGRGVDKSNSDGIVYLYNPVSDKYETSAPQFIERVGEPINPEDELAAAMSAIEEEHNAIFTENVVSHENIVPSENAVSAEDAMEESQEKNDSEANAVNEITAEEEPTPVGRGVFGNVYDSFKGKVRDAVSFLFKNKDGEAKGVFHREEIGEIGLIWGDDKKGLAHIISKHIVQNSDYNSVSELINVIDDVVNNGDITIQKGGNWRIDKDGHRVAIAKNDEGNFVITAYDNTRALGEKKRSEADATLFDQRVREEMDGTLVPSGFASAGKDNALSADKQGEGSESLALSRIPRDEAGNPVYEQADPATAWDGLTESMGGDEAAASELANTMVSNLERRVAGLQKRKLKGQTSAELTQEINERKKAVSAVTQELEHWRAIADMPRKKAEETLAGSANGIPLTRHHGAEGTAGKAAEETVGEAAGMVARESEVVKHETAGGDLLSYRHNGLLRELGEGEFSLMERRFSETGEFHFSGDSKIESADDVAYMMRNLEMKSVEHSFAVLTKDGVPTVVHLGMGTFNVSPVNLAAVKAADNALGGADRIWFVHNHPSGNLGNSPQDMSLHIALQDMFGDRLEPSIILDTLRGQYAEFGKTGNTDRLRPTRSRNGEEEVRVYQFDRAVYSKDYDFSKLSKIRVSGDVAAFLSGYRLGEGDKAGVLILDNMNQIVGNLPCTHSIDSPEGIDAIVNYAIHGGGTSVIVYGNDVMSRGKLAKLGEGISARSGKSIRLLDVITKNGNKFTSANDEGIMEPEVLYGETSGSRPQHGEETNVRFRDGDQKESRKIATADRIEELFDKAVRGDLTGKPVEVGTLTKDGKAYLEKLSGIKMKDEVSFVLNPSDLVHMYRDHYASNEKDKGNNIPLDKDDIRAIADIIVNPERVIFGKEPDGLKRNLFYFLSSAQGGTYNLLEIYGDRKGNLTAKTFYKTRKGVSQRVLSLMKSEHLTSVTDGATLSGDAKLPKFFEYPKSENDPDIRFREGDAIISGTATREKEDKVNELSDKLGVPVRIITTPEDINTLPSVRQRKSKGYWSSRDGVVVILPNNRDVADVENTFVHEVVGHKGLRAFIGEERFDEFLSEVYDHSSNPIRRVIDKMTDDMVNSEVERLRARKAEARERAGEDVNANYYADMAGARLEAEARRADFRREATEEYMADLGGRIGNDGFEKMSLEELTLWGKIKAKVQQFLDRFLQGLQIAKNIRLTDKDLAYILYKSWKNLRGKASGLRPQHGGIFAEAEDVVMRRRTGWDEAMLSESAKIEDANNRFNRQLQRWESGTMESNEVIDAGKPMGVMQHFMPDETLILRQKVLSKSRKKHGLSGEDMRGLPGALAHPIFVFQSNPKTISVLTELKSSTGQNLFVAVEVGVNKQLGHRTLEVNDILTVHGREIENIVLPIVENNSLVWVDKGKGLEWLSSAKSNSQAIASQTLEDAAKIIKSFENPKFEGDDIRFRDGDLGLEETITKMKAEALSSASASAQEKRDAMRAIGGNLNHLRQAMARQRKYDVATVRSVSDLARVLMDENLLDDLSRYEMKRILGVIDNVVGRQDVGRYVQKVMDIMIDNQLRMGANAFGRLLSVRGKRVDARGIEVQGELDPEGQGIAQVVRRSTSLPKDDIDNKIAEAGNRMGSPDKAIADEAAIEYAGLQIARQYVEDITESKAEEKDLRDSLKQAKEEKAAGLMSDDAYSQYVESVNDAIRQNRIERVESFHSLSEQLGGVLSESVERAKAWREAEKQRVNDIHHNANSDMEGRPTDEHHKDNRVEKIVNNDMVRFLFAPLATFDQMLRMFGNKNTRGEGYLWNRYMRGWVKATEREYTGYRDALKILDAKVREIFSSPSGSAQLKRPGDLKGPDDLKRWGDLFSLDRKLPKASVRFLDGGEMKDHELTQGNLLYIYMADKMSDGRMKLRRMGITQRDVEDIKNFLDPRFIQLADWMQEEFLVDKRNEYNEVHKRMFGASMAAIENYFPLKILSNARVEMVDVADDTAETALPATSTGSIIKRRRNNLALDVTGANAFSVILDHLQQMERWAAFAEFNRDLNTLLSYKRFRNQVMNMNSVYGGGKTLWKNFRNVCSMAAGAYRPPIAALDKAAVNIAKGVTAAKVSFRMFTALKQFLSMPAYVSDANPVYLAANIANPAGAWKWAMENLPLFEKRWSSRMSGDPRLLKSEMDWKMWRSRVVEIASRVGMSPNAFVDALTVAIGARSMYQTKLAKYKRLGYDEQVAEERAKQDATILFNQTQQSSESAFLSTMQVDRSWLSVLFTVFRNSSMSYTRQLYDSMRNIKRRFKPGYKVLSEEFMAKQMIRDGIDPDKAGRNAKQEYRRGIIRDMVRVGIFWYVLQFAWNLGAYLPYLILGDDEEDKDDMWNDVIAHSSFGSIEGLTGGDVYSNILNAIAKGESVTPWIASKDMPLASDIESIWTKWNTDEVSAMNDAINLLVQSVVGVNPQSLTDAVVAVMDYCGDDAQTSRECALLIARVINCPPSQLDKVYFDELDATGEEASQMTPYEIAERYARYKVRRGAPLTGWAYGSEQREKIMDRYRKKINTLAKEKIENLTDKAVSNRIPGWQDEYKATQERLKQVRSIRESDEERYYELLDDLEVTPEYERYEIIRDYKRDINALTKEWLRAKTPAQLDSCAKAIIERKREMVTELVDTQQ